MIVFLHTHGFTLLQTSFLEGVKDFAAQVINELQQDEELMKEFDELKDLDWKQWKDWKVGFEKIIVHENYKPDITSKITWGFSC